MSIVDNLSTYLNSCKCGRQTGAKCAVHKDENCFLFDPTRAKTSVCEEKYDDCATTLHVFNKQPPPSEAVSDSRGVPRCTEKNFKKLRMLTCVDRSTRPIHHTRTRDVHCHSSPLYHLPGELVSLSSVPVPSIDLNLWNLSRPSAFVPMSLGFTSVLTDDIVKFPRYQILNE